MTLVARVAAHLNTTGGLDDLGTPRMPCPRCRGDYGPTLPISWLAVFELGYLPGAPLLAGVCLDCGFVYEPAARTVDDLDATPEPAARSAPRGGPR